MLPFLDILSAGKVVLLKNYVILQSIKFERLCNGMYSCPACDKTFSTRSAIVRHYRTHTGMAFFSGVITYKNLVYTILSWSVLHFPYILLHFCSCWWVIITSHYSLEAVMPATLSLQDMV
jgi:hypothetical protein